MIERLLDSTGIPDKYLWMILFVVTLIITIYLLKMLWWSMFKKPKLSAYEVAEIKGKEQPNDR